MKKFVIVAFLLFASRAFAWVEVPFFATSAVVGGNFTAERADHAYDGSVTAWNGGAHTDLVLVDSGIWETGFIDIPYPSTFNGSDFLFYLNIETNETDTAKQACLRIQACAMTNQQNGRTCGDETVGIAYLVYQFPESGAAYTTQFVIGPSSVGTVYSAESLVPCAGQCAHNVVRLAIRREHILAACTNPTAEIIRIRGGVIRFQ